jgi:NADH-quinone oxidoreductase subunit N
MLLFAKLTFARPDLALGTMYPLLALGALMVIALCFELRAADSSSQESPESSASRPIAQVFAALGLLLLMVSYLIQGHGPAQTTFNGMLAGDSFSRWSGLLISACALLAILAGQDELERHHSRHGGEFVALILGASLGMVLMASALNTMVLFLGLELFSIALYLLCIFFPERAASRESGMKYFLLSSAASAVMLYGFALLYGATGTTWIMEMSKNPQGTESPLAAVGAVMVLCGLLFKLAVVPFHFWAPDVYEGAPTTVTAFMSVATKIAAVTALWRLFLTGAPELGFMVDFIITALAVVSMLLGNLAALAQTSVKRMLAFSGVANAGYLLIAPAVGVGMEGPMMYFLTTYLFANIGAFLSLSVVEGLLGREVSRSDLRGLYKTHPGLAAIFGLSLASLAGLPPAGGFLAKFFLFGRAISGEGLVMVAVAIICSVISVGYYLATAVSLFDGQAESAVERVEHGPSGEPGDVEPQPSLTSLALGLCAAGILLLGIVPAPYLAWLTP